MKELSEVQLTCIRQHVRSTFHDLENEEFIKNSEELMLRSIEITLFFVLADIVESLPSPVYEDVKRLLEVRERLWSKVHTQRSHERWNEIYSQLLKVDCRREP
jgi:hypothetical protein